MGYWVINQVTKTSGDFEARSRVLPGADGYTWKPNKSEV
jgi:hypothetical protein